MPADDKHSLRDCTDPLTCPRHKVNVVVQEANRVLILLEFAKRNEVPGQIPGGAAIEKQTWEPGDLHVPGAKGKVIGCLEVDGLRGYFVEWDDLPGQPVFLQAFKIRRAADQGGPHAG